LASVRKLAGLGVFPQVTELRLSNCPDLSLQASGVANRPEIRRQNSKGIEKNQKDMGSFCAA
jgi:hypothetical protein